MRLRRPTALALTAAALTLPLNPTATAAPRACETAPAPARFPITTRIDAGPDTYLPGADPRTWSITLTNRTLTRCTALHPVLVLVDDSRKLRPTGIRLEFRDGTRWHPVAFEHTDQDENVGVIGADTGGFSVEPGETVTVPVRLAFSEDARPDHVVADAALVQRRDDDGDWVGESGHYPFDIVTDDEGGGEEEAGEARADAENGGGDAATSDRPGGTTLAGELARTGPEAPLTALAATAGLCLLGGAAALLLIRRRTAARRH
ncbi:hypothetical protein ACFW9D_06655 [Streptomyces sp. NPDC059524]|uniref:hypothetical protein n=1 Tax=Streptomyces sp. NPDC059524 TaxID=3346856 RepID=UPI003684DE92